MGSVSSRSISTTSFRKMNRVGLASRPAASLLIARQGSSSVAKMMAIRRFTEDINPSRLFIGGLSWGTDENKLKEAFESFGEVRHVRVVVNRETGRSRGFGFVTFQSPEDAAAAAETMHDKELDGRRLSVSYARNSPQREGGFRQRSVEGKEEENM